MNIKQQRVVKVLERISEMVKNDEDCADDFVDILDRLLDKLHQNDFFGTEGQADPRGDFRDGDWSMNCVQGVDDE